MSDDEVEALENEEERLAKAAKDGCRAARNELFPRNAELIRRLTQPARRLLIMTVSYRRLSNPAIELEDIEQQAFLVFCKVLEEWNPDGERFNDCLTRRMPGHLLHYVRDTLRYSKYEREGIADYEQAAEEDSETEGHESRAGLPPYAVALPAHLQEALKLRYVDGLSCGRIARLIGRDRRTVNRKINTALAIMRESLQEMWEAV